MPANQQHGFAKLCAPKRFFVNVYLLSFDFPQHTFHLASSFTTSYDPVHLMDSW